MDYAIDKSSFINVYKKVIDDINNKVEWTMKFDEQERQEMIITATSKTEQLSKQIEKERMKGIYIY